MYRDRRSLHRSISQSRRINELDDDAALLYTWMIAHYDDYGRMSGEIDDVLYNVVPRRKMTVDRIIECLLAFEDRELIRWYVVNGKPFIEMIPEAWEEHQTFKGIKRSSKIPAYDKDNHEIYRDICLELKDPPSRDGKGVQVHPSQPEGVLREVKGSEEKSLSIDKPEEKASSDHFCERIGEEKEKILELCSRLKTKSESNGKRFNPYAWVQSKINEGEAHPQALIESLQGVHDYWSTIKKGPWPYADHIFNSKNSNYHEARNRAEAEELSKSWNQFIDSKGGRAIKELIGAAFSMPP